MTDLNNQAETPKPVYEIPQKPEILVEWLKENIRKILHLTGRPGNCEGCKAKIYWLLHIHTGKLAPYTELGLSHFADCPEAGKFKK